MKLNCFKKNTNVFTVFFFDGFIGEGMERSNKSADETVCGKTSNDEENGKLFQTVSY